MHLDAPAAAHDVLLNRICCEYLEMPGLRLRREQAQRLWSLDEDTCTHALDVLVQMGFLTRSSDGSYGLPSIVMSRGGTVMARGRLHEPRASRVTRGAA